MRRPAPALILLVLVLVAACAGRPSLDDPLRDGPDLVVEELFDGRLQARGEFRNLAGVVQRRFDIAMQGDWNGETLSLVENFSYDDDATERRAWTMRKSGPDTWTGTADGVIGVARGTVRGNTFNWVFTAQVPVQGGTVRARLDDWFWRLDERRVVSRAYVSRFGVDVGVATIAFERLD